MSKYTRQITQTLTDEDQGFTINVDVYDVLRAFTVTDPAIQHAIKKLLCTGIRGHKDSRQDLEEAVQSIERALDAVKVEELLNQPIDAEFEVVSGSPPVTGDDPQQSPVCPWKFGDVIRTRGKGKGTDFDWTITEITPRGIECRTGARGEISTFIPFASCKDYDLVSEVNADDSPECPFKIGDVVQHNMDIADQAGAKWQIVGITSEQLLVVNFNDHNDASHIERRFWRNYSRVGPVAPEAKEQPNCPFKVGDVIAKPNSTGWKIDRILSDRLHVISHDPYQTPSQIDRQFWPNYRIVTPTTIDAIQQTC